MNGLEASLVELVRLGESPVYSAYRWLANEIGRELPWPSFAALIDSLIAREILHLSYVDPASGRRATLSRTPDGLMQRYEALGHSDASFDPLALSLTLGPRAALEGGPEWSLRFEAGSNTFELDAAVGAEADALRQVRPLFPDLTFAEIDRKTSGARTRIVGSVVRTPT